MKLTGKIVLFRTIEICIWILCFCLIPYIIVNFIYPTMPITSDMSPVDLNIVKFNNTGILSKQVFYTFYLWVPLCCFIGGYYAILQVIRHKKKSRLKNGNEKISEQRKIIFYRLAVFAAFFLVTIPIIILFDNKELFSCAVFGLIFGSLSFLPFYLYYGLSKVYSFTFGLKIFGSCLVIILILVIVSNLLGIKISPILAGASTGALPLSKAYIKKINEAGEPFFKDFKFKKQQ